MPNKHDETINYSAKLVNGEFLVYEDGTMVDFETGKFYKHYDNGNGYREYRFKKDGSERRIKVHQLVGQVFLKNPDPENFKMINHIDGNKTNNHKSNLEWCDAYINNKHARDTYLNDVKKSNSDRWKNDEFRKKTSANISEGLKTSGCVSGHNNPRFKYMITDETTGKEFSRKELCDYLGNAQSTIDIWIKRAANGEQIPSFVKKNLTVHNVKK